MNKRIVFVLIIILTSMKKLIFKMNDAGGNKKIRINNKYCFTIINL